MLGEGYRLNAQARTRWPDLTSVEARIRTNFATLDACLADGTVLKLWRSPHADRRTPAASPSTGPGTMTTRTHYLHTGMPAGSSEDAIDCTCGLYVNDPIE